MKNAERLLWNNTAWMRREIAAKGVAEPQLGKVLIVGAGVELSSYIHGLSAMPERTCRIVGVITPELYDVTSIIADHDVLGTVDDLPSILDTITIDRILLLSHALDQDVVARVKEVAAEKGISCLQVDFTGGALPSRPQSRVFSRPRLSIPSEQGT